MKKLGFIFPLLLVFLFFCTQQVEGNDYKFLGFTSHNEEIVGVVQNNDENIPVKVGSLLDNYKIIGSDLNELIFEKKGVVSSLKIGDNFAQTFRRTVITNEHYDEEELGIKLLYSFSESRSMTTETLKLPSGWEVAWSHVGNGNFSIHYYKDRKSLSEGQIVNTMGTSEGSFYQGEGGEFYLQIINTSGEYSIYIMNVEQN